MRTLGRPKSVLVIGAGMSGLCMAIRLKQCGFQSVTILESSDEIGGTWSKNTYPNAGCDVPSHLYSFSFALNPRWSQKYARQPEILEYFRSCAERFGIQSQIRFGCKVESAVYDSNNAQWEVSTSETETLRADILVSAVGQLNRPYIPSFSGLEDFAGESWHSARWNHDYDFAGKTVAVVGNGASAVQFLPTVAESAQRTLVFQRTPSWIHPLTNRRYSTPARWSFANLPMLARMYRYWLYWMSEWRIIAFRQGSKINKEYARWLRRRMKRLLPEAYWEKLLPNYEPGCKRILLSNDYLQTLSRNDVEVIQDSIRGFTADGVNTEGKSFPCDAVIFATGFRSNEFLHPISIRGRDGTELESYWDGRPRAYQGLSVPQFPNFFMLYGPNTNLGHNSIIFMVEQQVELILRCLRRMNRAGAREVEIRPEAADRNQEDIQTALRDSVWAGECTNWYKSASGHIPNNWSGSALKYWYRLKRDRLDAFRFR
ncbi:MAG: NAD(P)/FAD-dependent oxidoreductase [Planctomycetota bacterium]